MATKALALPFKDQKSMCAHRIQLGDRLYMSAADDRGGHREES